MARDHALLVLAIALLGCGQRARPPGIGKEAARSQAILNKLHGYVECLSDHSARVFRISDLYLGHVGDAPLPPEDEVLLGQPADPEACLEAIFAASVLPPQLPELEAAGDAFRQALGTIFVLTMEGRDPAKSVARHAALVSAFREFDTAQGALFDEVYRLNRVVHIDQLAERERTAGRKLATIADWVLIEAEDLVRFGATPWDRLETLDHTALAKQIGAVEGVLDEMTAYAIEHKSEREGLDGYKAIAGHAMDYVIAARQLAQRARDNVTYSDAEKIMIRAGNEAGVIGSPAAMVKAYNRLAEMQ